MAAWTPADLATLEVWYDPSDSGARTITSSAFEGLENKEGTASRDINQSSSGSRPALASAAINGLDAMDFNGTSHWLGGDFGFMYGNGSITIAVVVKGTPTYDRYIITEGDSAATQSIYSLLKTAAVGSNNTPASFIRNSANTVLLSHGLTGSVDFVESPEVAHITSLTDSGSNVTHWVDGVEANSQNYTRSGTVNHNRFGIGALYRSAGAAAFYDGQLGEIVIASTTSEADRQKIEGYLAHKWGAASLLDAGHPYKAAPPSTGVEGTASATLTISGTATGTRTVAGTAAATLVVTGTATGARTVNGSAASSLTVTSTATGTRTVFGGAAAELTIIGTATGARTVNGSAASSLTVTSTATGTHTVLGAGTATLVVAGHASGSTLGEVQGTASASLTVTGTASGTRTVTATATASFEVAVVAAGTVTVSGTAQSVLAVVASAVGLRTVLGSAAAALEMAGVAAGTVVSDDAVTRRVQVTLGARSSILVRLNDG